MKKILVVETNIGTYGDRKEATGLWLGENTEFVREVTAAGYSVDYASPKGGYVPIDPRSIQYASKEDLQMYNDANFREKALSHTLKPTDVNSSDYQAIYFTGGHGVMWDFPHNNEFHQISLDIYNNGGFITSVCHGISALLYLKDRKGDYIIQNKKITGFTNTEEILSGKRNRVPILNEKVARSHGSIFQKKRAFSPYAVQDGNLITGQNPYSPKEVATLLIKNLK
ncbi:type 1 glutamine amidotransferase domain-containing protein [Lactobacillus terrae]|uniref:type 1 glutamine amidotransferase domain-containing protein n=1 Tax=Lactobacillus terrae TaxID=2269374 RepID=UPI000C1B7723|nr:type 1 glutamine amidotransferase domain-containing protein [Lactobacillus terrae]